VNRWISDTEVANFFRRADVLVAPYREASQSGVIPIACALGLPVVATRVGGLIEQVEDGKTGLLVEPNNPEQLADACVQLLLDSTLANSLAEGGRRRASQEWNWDRITGMVIDSCEKTIDSSTRGTL